MTDREKAIVMAYTGYCMLAGDKLKVFYEYVGELLGRPVYTHEFADPDIQEKDSNDFYKLCRETTPEDMDDLQKDADYWHKLSQSYAHTICAMDSLLRKSRNEEWIPCSERLPENDDDVLVTTSMGYVTEGKYWHEEKLWIKNLTCMSVTAWMPLPEPWKEEKAEGEPIPQWRGCMDGCLPFSDGGE